MQAIVTKYIGPRVVKGSRVSACTEGGARITIAWDSSLSVERNHAMAARALVLKLGWRGTYVGAGLPNGGFAFVPWNTDVEFRVDRRALGEKPCGHA